MDVGTRWNLEGCTDAAFVEQAIALVEKVRSGLCGPIFALQEYGPGIVAMRDSNRCFVVVYDDERWSDGGNPGSPQAVYMGNSYAIRFVSFPNSRENFDDLFAHTREAISPKSSTARWHKQRPTPILASS